VSPSTNTSFFPRIEGPDVGVGGEWRFVPPPPPDAAVRGAQWHRLNPNNPSQEVQ